MGLGPLMCRDCRHWITREAFDSQGLRFAPCALKPDRIVKDRRTPTGTDLQAYVTEAGFECAQFVQRLGT